MFIQFLQEESSVKLPGSPGCGCEKHEVRERKAPRPARQADREETITVLRRYSSHRHL